MEGRNYEFHYLPTAKNTFQSDHKRMKEYLMKWSIWDGFKMQAFSFDKPFKQYLHEGFIKDFFSSPNVISNLQRATESRDFIPIGSPADCVKFKEIPATVTSMAIFDNLKKDNLVVRSNGAIVKCAPQYVKPTDSAEFEDDVHANEIEITDMLHKVFLLDFLDPFEHDDFEALSAIFSEKERQEFIVCLFHHMVIGGSLCQYEDNIQPYVDVVKNLYKELITVVAPQTFEQGDSASSFHVRSRVYRIYSAKNEEEHECLMENHELNSLRTTNPPSDLLFYQRQINNFLYLIVDPTKQLCYTLYHQVH